MPITKLLVANRGEIAIRIVRAARELGIDSVAIHSQDDASSLHVRRADEAVALDGVGARAYLDVEAVIGAAKASGCDALHPGYGFLAESRRTGPALRRGGDHFRWTDRRFAHAVRRQSAGTGIGRRT